MSNTTTIRRGTPVLSYLSDTRGVGRVEGMCYAGGDFGTEYVVRWATGVVESWTAVEGWLAPVDSSTTVVEDQFNNVNRHCSVRGDAAQGLPVRCWRIVAALNRSRYLVYREDIASLDQEVRVVDHRDLSNLY